MPLDDQQPALEHGAGIPVRFESLRGGWDLRQATPQPGALTASTPTRCYQRPDRVHLGALLKRQRELGQLLIRMAHTEVDLEIGPQE